MNPQSLLGHCLSLLEQIHRNQVTPADELTSSYARKRKYLGAKERRALSELVFATLRTQNTAIYLAEQVCIPGCPNELLALLGAVAATAQLWAGVDVQDLLDAAAATATCPTAALEQLYTQHTGALLPPGWHNILHEALYVLESSTASTPQQMALQSCLPEWIVRHFLERAIDAEQIRLLGSALARPAQVVLRRTNRSVPREKLIELLQRDGIVAYPSPLSPDGIVLTHRRQILEHPLYRSGNLELQDEGSQFIGFAVAPEPTWRILDACAGAGGKTLHLASLISDKGTIVASDIDASRLQRLRIRAHRQGLSSIQIQLLNRLTASELGKLYGSFNAVLLDVPCTGTGTVRRSPEIKWRLKSSQVERYSQRQLHILQTYAPFVRRGGILIYATCSLLHAENEEVISQFLNQHSEFAPDPLQPAFAQYGITLPLEPDQWTLRLTPHEHGTDGFFIARLRRL